MTEPNTLKLIIEHFKAVAESLSNQASDAGLLANATGVGTEREEVYKSFLERHVPKICDVFLGGYVFDLQGNRSKQIDVIVAGGNAPRFQLSGGNKYIAPLEGTIAVVEVKSKLDKKTLREALDNFSSIPRVPDPETIVPPFLAFNEESWQDLPYKIVFAYDGIERDSLCEHLFNFIKENKNQPPSRLPNIIHVLGKYTLRRVHSSQIRNRSTGDVVPDIATAYYTFKKNADVLAMMEILNTIQHGAFLSNYLKYDYAEWYGQILELLKDD